MILKNIFALKTILFISIVCLIPIVLEVTSNLDLGPLKAFEKVGQKNIFKGLFATLILMIVFMGAGTKLYLKQLDSINYSVIENEQSERINEAIKEINRSNKLVEENKIFDLIKNNEKINKNRKLMNDIVHKYKSGQTKFIISIMIFIIFLIGIYYLCYYKSNFNQLCNCLLIISSLVIVLNFFMPPTYFEDEITMLVNNYYFPNEIEKNRVEKIHKYNQEIGKKANEIHKSKELRLVSPAEKNLKGLRGLINNGKIPEIYLLSIQMLFPFFLSLKVLVRDKDKNNRRLKRSSKRFQKKKR